MYEQELHHLVLSAEGKGGRMIWHALSLVPRILKTASFCIRDTRLNSIGWCSQPVPWSGSIIPNLHDKEANCENNRQHFLDWWHGGLSANSHLLCSCSSQFFGWNLAPTRLARHPKTLWSSAGSRSLEDEDSRLRELYRAGSNEVTRCNNDATPCLPQETTHWCVLVTSPLQIDGMIPMHRRRRRKRAINWSLLVHVDV